MYIVKNMWLFHPIFVFVLSPYVAYERPILHVNHFGGKTPYPRNYSCGSGGSLGVLRDARGRADSYLFQVEKGVKTGCPLSSILFLLAINPFVHLLQWLSDSPGLSETRICADDFGSALKQLSVLKTQHSIFRMTGPVAGLFLKPSKCVLVITCMDLLKTSEYLSSNGLRLMPLCSETLKSRLMVSI